MDVNRPIKDLIFLVMDFIEIDRLKGSEKVYADSRNQILLQSEQTFIDPTGLQKWYYYLVIMDEIEGKVLSPTGSRNFRPETTKP